MTQDLFFLTLSYDTKNVSQEQKQSMGITPNLKVLGIKDTLNRVKKQPSKWEGYIYKPCSSYVVCIQNLLYEEFLELNRKKKSKNGQRT